MTSEHQNQYSAALNSMHCKHALTPSNIEETSLISGRKVIIAEQKLKQISQRPYPERRIASSNFRTKGLHL